MSNVTHFKPVADDAIQLARAEYLWGAFKAERWTLRPLQLRTGIPKSTLAAKMSGASAITMNDIEILAPVLDLTPVELFTRLLALAPHNENGPGGGTPRPSVPPTGIEPATFGTGNQRSIP